MSSNSIVELASSPEGKTLEFKRDLSSPKPLLKALVAFANTAGGRLVIGIADDRQIIGVSNPLDEEERLCNLIADSIAPRLVPNVEMLTVEGKTLLVVEVFVSGNRPHWLKSEGAETGVYVRLGSSSRQADAALIGELRRSVEGVAFDEMPMPDLGLNALDLDGARKLFSGISTLDPQALHTLKLVTLYQGQMVPTKGAVLLFGKERALHFSDAWVQCGRFIGTDKAKIFDHVDIHEHLPIAVDSIMLFLKKHAMRGADFSTVRRKDVWSIPLLLLREAVINALVHADYSQRGAPIRVSFFDDRIEVESPGILLPGMTIEDMRQGVSKIRNHVLARVFRELNLIEQWGSGVRRIFREAQELGLPEPQFVEVGMRLRVVVFLAETLPLKRTTEQVTEQVT
ncbi:MAG: putative DNA binding domain-containing protein, partial [Rhodoferax sp.]|nr:putative DNA binding domain-containing protein [Rhodoferax sp.]